MDVTPYDQERISLPIIPPAVLEPLAVPQFERETKSLDFLENITHFHFGCMPNPRTPRFTTIYLPAMRRYIALLEGIIPLLDSVTITTVDGRMQLDLEQRFLWEIYDDFDIYQAYPFHNVMYRIASVVHAIRLKPLPQFQRRLVMSLPLELLHIIVDYVDDDDIDSLANTCLTFYQLSRPRVEFKSAYFPMRYDARVLHGPGDEEEDTIYLDALDEMLLSRTRTMDSLQRFASCATRNRRVRVVTFDNEWPRMWPVYLSRDTLLPSRNDSEIFDPFYNSIISHVAQMSITHIRFISLMLPNRLAEHISGHPTITSLSIERCSPTPFPYGFFHDRPMLVNISSLAIGFEGDATEQRMQWLLVALCPCLQRFHAYPAPGDSDVVYYPYYTHNLLHFNYVEDLHIHGSTAYIGRLTSWIHLSSVVVGDHGRLRRLKIHSFAPIFYEEIFSLVSALGQCHPHLTVLSLEGIDKIPSMLLSDIRCRLEHLEALTLVRRGGTSQKLNKLCAWDEPIYNYADALRDHPTLQHLAINYLCVPNTFSPSILDRLLDSAGPTPSTRGVPATYKLADRDHIDDVRSTARLFASLCPALKSFAVVEDIPVFACTIERIWSRFYWLKVINDDALTPEMFAKWNPTLDDTWPTHSTD